MSVRSCPRVVWPVRGRSSGGRASRQWWTLPHAFVEGRIHYSTARELTRIATDETEDAWLGAAVGKDAREIESLVSCHPPGETPETPPTPPASVRVSFEVSLSTKALLAEARERMIKARGASVSDDELLMARGGVTRWTSATRSRRAQGKAPGSWRPVA